MSFELWIDRFSCVSLYHLGRSLLGIWLLRISAASGYQLDVRIDECISIRIIAWGYSILV